MSWPTDRRITIKDLQAATQAGDRWAMLTSYDAFTAGVFEEAGVQALLVGDTAGMVVFGRPDTISVTVDELMPLVRAVVAGTSRTLVVADLPFGSYQVSPQQALETAIRFAKEGGAHAIKLEGGREVCAHVEAIVTAGIPVMGHVGLTPQSVHQLGGMRRVQGRGADADVVLADALGLEESGAFAVVLEAVPASLAAKISEALAIPTVGIGAGAQCDAQILVWQDMLGLTPGGLPRFVKQYADLRSLMRDATAQFVDEVESGKYPDDAHSYF